MSNIEKSKEKEILKSGHGDGDLKLLREFRNLKPLHSSNLEAAESAVRKLEEIAINHGQSIEELLLEAHSSDELKEHHGQVLTLERMIGQFKK